MNDLQERCTTVLDRVEAVPLTIRVRLVSANSGKPLPGQPIGLWHCGDDPDVRVSDAAGWAEFTAAFPVAGPGHWPHVHVATDRHATRLGLPADACGQAYATAAPSRADLAAAFSDGHPVAMALVTGDARRGFVATRTVSV
jgi:protocatechuate 3,4-dioxygenase beta subunit